MNGKCPACGSIPNVLVLSLRARDETAQRTVPVLQFICDRCSTILGVALDPEWQAQVVASQLRSVSSGTTH
jgi:hypothetical protein